MMMMFKAPLLACTALCLAATTAQAQLQPDPAQIFEAADANKDSKITQDEYRAARAKLFSKLDRNGDGFIDKQDKRRRLRTQKEGEGEDRLAEFMGEYDTDGDGRISQAEFNNHPMQGFERVDTDKNGELSAAEIAAAKAVLKNIKAQKAGSR
jgi:hypothetical protein